MFWSWSRSIGTATSYALSPWRHGHPDPRGRTARDPRRRRDSCARPALTNCCRPLTFRPSSRRPRRNPALIGEPCRRMKAGAILVNVTWAPHTRMPGPALRSARSAALCSPRAPCRRHPMWLLPTADQPHVSGSCAITGSRDRAVADNRALRAGPPLLHLSISRGYESRFRGIAEKTIAVRRVKSYHPCPPCSGFA